MNKPPVIFTSWDDGDPLDMRVAQLLLEYRLPGIFFWPVSAIANKPQWTFDIAAKFQIGGHTVNHRQLTKIDPADAEAEIEDGRKWLQETYRQPIEWFCYPRGRYTAETIELVEWTGFHYARTTKLGHWDGHSKPLEVPADVHCFQRPEYGKQPWTMYFLREWEYALRFEHPVFHLWGHSWEIDKHDDWQALEWCFERIRKDLDLYENLHR